MNRNETAARAGWSGRRRGLAGLAAGRAQQHVKSGTVDIEQVTVAFIGSGGVGGGTCISRAAAIASRSAGWASAASACVADGGDGRRLQFASARPVPGAYGSARYGAAFGDQGGGQLWLHPQGVILALRARRQGSCRVAWRRRRDHRLQVRRQDHEQHHPLGASAALVSGCAGGCSERAAAVTRSPSSPTARS